MFGLKRALIGGRITVVELEITAVELEMKKSDPTRGEERLKECGGAEMVKKVDKEGSGRIAGGMDQQDGAGQAWRWNLVTGKWAWPTRAGGWKAGRRRRVACGGAWRAIFQRGFLQRVDRPCAPQNMRFPAGEGLVGKSHRQQGDPMTAAAAEGFGRRIK